MLDESIGFSDLSRMLQVAPVIAGVHPLVPLCLDSDTQIVRDAHEYLAAIDDQNQTLTSPALIVSDDPVLRRRFVVVRSLAHPPIDAINRNMKYHLNYAREHLLTTHKVAKFIERDVAHHQYELVVLLLVDGLSYEDVLDWGTEVSPCFVDGPSVTFRFDENSDELLHTVGFAAIVGNPPIAARLYRLGYRYSYGYTYWRARDNILAQYMFRGIPDNRVLNFQAVLQIIDDEPIPARSYVQIVREGLDGLAHSKRELRTPEVCGAVRALKDDIEHLCTVIQRKCQSSVIYITADHGILWKNDHNWEIINAPGSKPRYSRSRPDEVLLDYVVRMENSGNPFYVFTYPYLGAPIRKNDSGVHGGLSYQESLVPFIKIEV